jgi:hypothetical protein
MRVPFVPFRSNLDRSDGFNANDAPYVRSPKPYLRCNQLNTCILQVLSNVAQILFADVWPNQFRWINPSAAAAVAQGGGAAGGS